jgi:GT2 family glycosyltransferase
LIAACQPKILSFHNKGFFEYAGASGGFIDKLGYPFLRGRIFDICEKDEKQYDNAMQCFWASGAALFVKAKVYQEMGGLDPFFFAHQEEIDLCWRMQLHGYKIFVQPASVVYHVGGGTLPKGSSRKVFLNYRNNLIMLAKNLTPLQSIFVLPVRFGLDALSAYKELFGGDFGYFKAVVKSHLAFFNWLIFNRRQSLFAKKQNKIGSGVYNGSIVWQFFIKKRKNFAEIVKN